MNVFRTDWNTLKYIKTYIQAYSGVLKCSTRLKQPGKISSCNYMLANYLKTASRNILREKGSSIPNIAGLTLGISCSLVLFLLVKHLSGFDNYHKNRDRILIGFLIASPIVWFLMNKWLENFAYKISIGPFVFITGLALTLSVAVLTVGYRSFKAPPS